MGQTLLIALVAVGCGENSSDDRRSDIPPPDAHKEALRQSVPHIQGGYNCPEYPTASPAPQTVLLLLKLGDSANEGEFEAMRRVDMKIRHHERDHVYGSWKFEPPDRVILFPSPHSRAYRRAKPEERIVMMINGKEMRAPEREVTPKILGSSLRYIRHHDGPIR